MLSEIFLGAFSASTKNLSDRFCAFRKREASGSIVALGM